MKIGIDARLWNETGVGRYIRNLVKYLAVLDKKNEYVLFIRPEDHNEVEKNISRNIALRKTTIRWHSLNEQIAFPLLLKKENLDLMHFPYFSSPVLYNKPFVTTIHDLIIHHYPTGKASTLPLPLYKLKHFGYKTVINQTIKKAEKIIVPLKATKKDLIKTLHVPSDKIAVTYEGFDTDIDINEKKEKLQATNQKYFLYVGNAYPHKNLDTLIAAFLHLRNKIVDEEIYLFLVGKEDFFYKRLERKLQRNHTQSIRVFHKVSDTLLSDLYSNAQAVIAPSFMEGFGLVPLEAMALSTIVVASDIPSHKEVCDDAAIYFDPTRKEDLEFALTKVLTFNREDKQKYITKGLKRVNHFSWKTMAEETIKIYESCVSVRQS